MGRRGRTTSSTRHRRREILLLCCLCRRRRRSRIVDSLLHCWRRRPPLPIRHHGRSRCLLRCTCCCLFCSLRINHRTPVRVRRWSAHSRSLSRCWGLSCRSLCCCRRRIGICDSLLRCRSGRQLLDDGLGFAAAGIDAALSHCPARNSLASGYPTATNSCITSRSLLSINLGHILLHLAAELDGRSGLSSGCGSGSRVSMECSQRLRLAFCA